MCYIKYYIPQNRFIIAYFSINIRTAKDVSYTSKYNQEKVTTEDDVITTYP